AEDRSGDDSSNEPEAGDRERPQAQVTPKQSRACTLALQVEQLAVLVAHVGHETEEDSDQRERERNRGGGAEHEQRPARERLAVQFVLDLCVRLNREHVERWPRQRAEV